MRLLDPAAHVGLAHQVLRPPAGFVLFQFAHDPAQLRRRPAVTAGLRVVLEVAFPVRVVIALAGQVGDLLVERRPRLGDADQGRRARSPGPRSAFLLQPLDFAVLQAEEDVGGQVDELDRDVVVVAQQIAWYSGL